MNGSIASSRKEGTCAKRGSSGRHSGWCAWATGTRIDGSASWEAQARCGLMARRLRRFQARMRPLPARQHQQAVRICHLAAPPQQLAIFKGVARSSDVDALPPYPKDGRVYCIPPHFGIGRSRLLVKASSQSPSPSQFPRKYRRRRCQPRGPETIYYIVLFTASEDNR